MIDTPEPTKRQRLHEAEPRFLFVLKRKRNLGREEALAKESRQIESMVILLCGLVLVAMILLVLRVAHQHWR